MTSKTTMQVLAILIVSLSFLGCSSDQPTRATANPYWKTVVDYLNRKDYTADKVAYAEKDLRIEPELDKALSIVGISSYTLLRNEPFARHGYTFKDPILQEVFSYTKWYKPNPDFQFNQLSKLEVKNIEFIKSVETTYDYENIAKALNQLRSSREPIFLSTMEEFFGHEAKMSLNHLRLNPSRVLRNYIFAKQGYSFRDPVLREIFSRTNWYKPEFNDLMQATAGMKQTEFVDVELLKKKEWMEILDAVNFTLPKGVISVPTVGYNALFIRQLDHQGRTYYFSSQFIHTAIAADATMFDNHRTDVEKLVSEDVVRQIKEEKDPARKLALFFDNKKYHGYVDTIVFNETDMSVPSYLKEAVSSYGVDYRVLLRKEIHARAGAKFIDKKSGGIFSQCRWFKPRYDMTPRTVSRLPDSVKLSRQELINFSLLEGEELAPNAVRYKDKNMVVDLSGNTYFVKVERVSIANTPGEMLDIGVEFPSIEAYETGSVQQVVNELTEKFKFDAVYYQEMEQRYGAMGC